MLKSVLVSAFVTLASAQFGQPYGQLYGQAYAQPYVQSYNNVYGGYVPQPLASRYAANYPFSNMNIRYGNAIPIKVAPVAPVAPVVQPMVKPVQPVKPEPMEDDLVAEIVPPHSGGAVECSVAEPQSPRDVSPGSKGQLKGRGSAVDLEHVSELIHVNTHYHWGAEHRSEGEYDDLTEPKLEDQGKPVKSGFFCSKMVATLKKKHLKSYNFKYCSNTQVGGTYEFHWVYSSAGDKVGGGLMGAFKRQMNPLVAVQAQTFVVVNDDTGAYDHDLFHGKTFLKLGSDLVRYVGSTTGPKYGNSGDCSPFRINWHVDRKCQVVSAKSMDAMCKKMKTHSMKADTHPHGSRDLVSEALSAIRLQKLV